MNVGVLPVQVSDIFAEEIFKAIYDDASTELVIDLAAQSITISSTNSQESFDINNYKKQNMLNGFDDIDYLQNIKEDIRIFAENTPL